MRIQLRKLVRYFRASVGIPSESIDIGLQLRDLFAEIVFNLQHPAHRLARLFGGRGSIALQVWTDERASFVEFTTTFALSPAARPERVDQLLTFEFGCWSTSFLGGTWAEFDLAHDQ